MSDFEAYAGEDVVEGDDLLETGDAEVGAVRLSPALLRRLRLVRGVRPRLALPRPRVARAAPAAGAPDVGIVLGLGEVWMQGNATSGILDAVVQEPFRIEDIVLVTQYSQSPWLGSPLLVSDVKLGTRSLMGGTEPFPAAALSPEAVNRPRLGRGLVVGAGKTITILLSFTTAVPLEQSCRASATVFGSAR